LKEHISHLIGIWREGMDEYGSTQLCLLELRHLESTVNDYIDLILEDIGE
jgi:hypothetical protein